MKTYKEEKNLRDFFKGPSDGFFCKILRDFLRPQILENLNLRDFHGFLRDLGRNPVDCLAIKNPYRVERRKTRKFCLPEGMSKLF